MDRESKGIGLAVETTIKISWTSDLIVFGRLGVTDSVCDLLPPFTELVPGVG